jgi:hypothetical protein
MNTEKIIENLKEKVKNQVGREQSSGFKLLTNYYPNDACDQIDDIFKIIESKLKSLQDEPEEQGVKSAERFQKPSDKELVEIALLFNDGKLQKTKLRDMVAMSEFIIDRLYENGNCMTKSSKED